MSLVTPHISTAHPARAAGRKPTASEPPAIIQPMATKLPDFLENGSAVRTPSGMLVTIKFGYLASQAEYATTTPAPYTVDASPMPQTASSNPSLPPTLPPVTSQELEDTRQSHVKSALGPDGWRQYQSATTVEERNRLFDQAMMKRAMEYNAKRNASLPFKKSWIQSWNIEKDYGGDDSRRYIESLNAALDNDAIRNSPVVSEFLQQNLGKLDKLSPLLLTELQLRVTAAELQQPGVAGLGLPALLALTPEPSIRQNALAQLFNSKKEYDAFAAAPGTPEQFTEKIRSVIVDYCYRTLAATGMQTWSTPEVVHQVVGDLNYDKSFTWVNPDHGSNDVAAMFGPAGSKLFSAGSDGLGPPPTSPEEKNANRLRLFAASDVFRRFQDLTEVAMIK